MRHENFVLDYILEHEKQDFKENPSYTHVYFHAYAACYGEHEATKLLLQYKIESEL